MKRRLSLKWLSLAFASYTLACSEAGSDSFVSVRKDRARLIEPFHSYASVEEAQSLLSKNGYSWRVIEDNHTVKEGEKRPPFRVYSVEANDFESFGHRGRLILQFFNNRLLSTTFYPQLSSEYKAVIQKAYSTALAPEMQLDDKTRLRTAVDYEQRFYVEWEDVRLAAELHRWIMRYA